MTAMGGRIYIEPNGFASSRFVVVLAVARRRPEPPAATASLDREDARRLGAEARVARLHDLVDEAESLVERRERALHRVDRQPLHLAQADPERLVEGRELARQRHAAHQPVVRVDRDAEPQPAKQVDRVLGDRGRRACVDVRGRTHLERDAAVADEGRQPTELDGPVVAHGDVVDDPHAMPEPLRATELERLPDRWQPE